MAVAPWVQHPSSYRSQRWLTDLLQIGRYAWDVGVMKPRRRRRLSTGHQSNYVKVIEQSDDNKLHYDIVNNAVNLDDMNEIIISAKFNPVLYSGEGTQGGYQYLAAEEE